MHIGNSISHYKYVKVQQNGLASWFAIHLTISSRERLHIKNNAQKWSSKISLRYHQTRRLISWAKHWRRKTKQTAKI